MSFASLVQRDTFSIPAAPPGFRFGGGDILGGRPRRGSGGGAPPPPGRQKMLKISKKFLKKIAKNWLFYAIFQNKLKTLR